MQKFLINWIRHQPSKVDQQLFDFSLFKQGELPSNVWFTYDTASLQKNGLTATRRPGAWGRSCSGRGRWGWRCRTRPQLFSATSSRPRTTPTFNYGVFIIFKKHKGNKSLSLHRGGQFFLFSLPLFKHIAPIARFASQMALQGFLWLLSFCLPVTSPKTHWSISQQALGEKECT